MRYCRTCGLANEDLAICTECGMDPHAPRIVAKCVPAHVPVAGYISFSQLSQLVEQIPDEVVPRESKPELPKLPTDWFSMSMGLVKWMGVAVTCLIMAFFVIVVLKAFM